MDNLKIIFECLSVVAGGFVGGSALVFVIARIFGKNLIDEWFARRNQKYQLKLNAELAEYKSILDSKLEVLKISYGNVFSERMSIFKEACVRMQQVEDYYNLLKAYNSYDCKDKVDYEKPCKQNCHNKCIVNYRNVVSEMQQYILETNNWFMSNEFFFSLDQYEEVLRISIEFFALLNKALDVIHDLSLSEKERADRCFSIFAEFEMDKYTAARKRLIETFRYTINVPLFSK
ncbi:MAG: hypothetical protein IKY67_10785 [Paludibacteraceae bacterium]|nr:hypothetical protein [Paludibacteraceae bacterium]MBR5824612.1 hypothetical protein [Paludibacteraceae bacterium]